MAEGVSGVSSGNRTQEVSNNQNNSTTTATATKTETTNFSNDTASVNNVTGAQEKQLYNQADVTKTNLQAQVREVPRMDATSEARLARVNPELATRVRAMAADLKAQGIDVMVTSGLRTFDEQRALYAQGRESLATVNSLRQQAGMAPISASANRSTVTNAQPGSSFHNYGLAVDVVPLDANGQPNWGASNATWNAIGAAGEKYGMEWGGRWTSIVDKPHFQLAGGRSASSYRDLYNREGLQAVWNDVNSRTPAAGNLPTTPTTPTNPTNPTNPTTPGGNKLEFGSRGDAVTQLQRDLTRLGYPLEDDGIFGRQTDEAVKKFQRDHGLEPDGIVGPRTRAAIDRATTPVPTARLEQGARGEQVRELQDALVKLGFMTQAQMNTGPGTFGPRTDAALKAFQRSQGLTADGIYGPRSQAALRTALGGTAPTTPTNPTNPTTPATTVSGARIDDILRGTNLAGKGDLIARLSQQYNIPAELALAMFRKEASFATDGSLADRNNNPGNIRFVGQAGATRGAGGFARWDSMDQGIEAYFGLLDRGYRSFIDNQDWAGMVNKYAPPSENDSALYTRQITQWMNDYRQRLN